MSNTIQTEMERQSQDVTPENFLCSNCKNYKGGCACEKNVFVAFEGANTSLCSFYQRGRKVMGYNKDKLPRPKRTQHEHRRPDFDQKHQIDRFRRALEQSRKGEPPDLSEEDFALFSDIQTEGIIKAQSRSRYNISVSSLTAPNIGLDRPDREKIAEKIAESHGYVYPCGVEEEDDSFRYWADQIVALCEEEIAQKCTVAFDTGLTMGKKQEIDCLDKVLQMTVVGKLNEWHWALSDEAWQEIKKDVPLTDRSGFIKPIVEEAKREAQERILKNLRLLNQKDFNITEAIMAIEDSIIR